jgi:diguanylate cyclase (GGDEF)-like protein/PAS domain S-box-containing protein
MHDEMEGQAGRGGHPTAAAAVCLDAALLQGVGDLMGCALLVLDAELCVQLVAVGLPPAAGCGLPQEAVAVLPHELSELARASLTGRKPLETTLMFGEVEWSAHARPLSDGGPHALLLALQPAASAPSGTALTALRAEALDVIASGVIIVDARMPHRPVIHASESFGQLTGYSREEILGRNCRFLQGPDTDPVTVAEIREAVRQGRPCDTEILNYRKDGTPFWNHLRITPLHSADGEPMFYVGVQHDVTEARLRDRASERRALHDSLTGLPNRRLLESRLEHLMQTSTSGFWLLFIDLDGFKAVNDGAGHRVGDAVLVRSAERLARAARGDDLLARLGGDEFVMLLAEEPPIEAVLRICDHLVSGMAEPFRMREGTFRLGASVGLAHWPIDAADAAGLLEAADLAMYRAKQRGGGCYAFASDDHTRRARAHDTMQQAMRTTVHDIGVVLRYQPVVDTDGQVAAAQAQVRWRDAASERLLPGSVFQVAARSGELLSVAEWMFRSLAEERQRWGRNVPDGLRLQVGFSVEQARSPAFLRLVEEQPAELLARLDVELPSALADDRHLVVEQLIATLRQSGAHLLLADFGDSPVSLQWLIDHRPLHGVKLSQHWVARGVKASTHRPALEALLLLARTAEAEVMAEGVRTREERDWLVDHGCRLMQGALWGEAVDAVALPGLLAAGPSAASAESRVR